MNAFMETIIQGWPDSIKGLPTDVLVFWSFHDELAVEDGIIFKGKQVLIPESLRAFLPNSISFTKALGRYVTTFQNIPVTPLLATTSENVTEEIRKAVPLFGQPNKIVSNNTSQYIRKPCTVVPGLCPQVGHPTHHLIPWFPQSNGFIGRQVQTIKMIIKKCKKEKQNIHLAMLDLPATPWAGLSPHCFVFTPLHLPSLLHSVNIWITVNYEHTLTDMRASLPPLHKGQNVRVLLSDKASKPLIPGEVTGHSGEPRSYNVRTNQRSNIHHSRGDLREVPQQDCADTRNQPGVATQPHPRPTTLETPSAIITCVTDAHRLKQTSLELLSEWLWDFLCLCPFLGEKLKTSVL